MNIYKISQQVNNDYDTYDSAVVIAVSEDVAREMQPTDGSPYDPTEKYWCSSWAKPHDVTVEFLGLTLPGAKAGVVVASFNAG